MKVLILIFSMLGVIESCQEKRADTYPKEVSMRVNHYRQTCEGEGIFECLLVQEGNQIGTKDWTLFYDEISGFQYEPGYVYTLKVNIDTVPNPPADGSSLRYSLIKLISKDKVKK